MFSTSSVVKIMTATAAVSSVWILAACGGASNVIPAGGPTRLPSATSATAFMQSVTPAAASPGTMRVPPMSTARSTMALRKPQRDIQAASFAQLPGAAVAVAASPDGTFWVLSTQGLPSGDKYIYHYTGGTFVNVPGAAVRIAVGPDSTPWVLTATGGIYHLVDGAFTGIAGGASELSVGADGSLYVISNQPGGSVGNGIFKYSNGTWTQLPGAGTTIAASLDPGSYGALAIQPGGFYVTNAQGSIYYYNVATGFEQLPGGAVSLAPTVSGGLFALGDPGAYQHGIYYNNLSTGQWTTMQGAAVSLSANASNVYAVGAAGGIYASSLTPVTTSTTFPGGASLIATMTGALPAAARSALFIFTPNGGASSNSFVSLPSSCTATPPCSVTLGAPIGTNLSVEVFLYASADATGAQLAVASATTTTLTNQATTLTLPTSGIMSTFTVGLNPATVTTGLTSPINVTENAFDASGEPLAAGFLTTSLTVPAFAVSVSDPLGFSTAGRYSGIGAGPISYTVQTPNYPAVTANLSVNAATAFTALLALTTSPQGGATPCDTSVYGANSATASRDYILCSGHPEFDANGTLWGAATVGINQDGTSAGALPVPGTVLGFDHSGKTYTVQNGSNSVNVYSGTTLAREINTAAFPLSVAIDPTGNVYVSTANGLYEYAPSGSGDLTPIATNTSAGKAAFDASGNLYAIYSGGIGIWTNGTFSAAAPARTIPQPNPGIYGVLDFGVDAAGDIFMVQAGSRGTGNGLFVAAAGATTFTASPYITTAAQAIALPLH